MKKLILLSTVVAAGLSLNAATYEQLSYYNYSFNECPTTELPDGWTCFGGDQTPTAAAANFGFTADGPQYLVLDAGNGERAAFSNSSYTPAATASNFLVSPAIEMTTDNAILQFKVYALTNAVKDHLYNIYVSTTGNSAEDFAGLEPIYEAKVGGTGKENAIALVAKEINVALNGYEGQTIYIAFEDASRDALLTGFSNINICQYALDVVNNTPSYSFTPGSFNVAMKVGILTPEACTGFTATMYDEEGNVLSIVENDKKIGQRYNTYNVNFPDKLEVTELNQVLRYKVSIQPNLENLDPMTFDYTLSCGEGFPAVCVMEETTCTGCQFCTRGIAYLNYFADQYGDQFIGIAVHNTWQGADPMATDYTTEFNSAFQTSGNPSALINRKGAFVDPSATAAVKAATNGQSAARINIESIAYDGDTGVVTVSYTPEFSFPLSGKFGAAAIVREDGVHGNGAQWSQSNAYSGTKAGEVGSELWPYFEWLASQPSIIPFSVMKYDHVGWGVFNDFNGSTANLPTQFEAGKADTYTLTFDMPEEVQDWENTSIVMILTDLSTGEILTGSVMEAEEYEYSSSVKSINANPAMAYNAFKQGNMLQVNAEAGATVDFFAIDGTRLASYKMNAATGNFSMPRTSGVVLVRISNGNNSRIVKVM